MGKADFNREQTETIIIPTCPIHNYTGQHSLAPSVMGCKSCAEVDHIHLVKSEDMERGYVKSHLAEAIIRKMIEDVESGRCKTVDDLVAPFEIYKNDQKLAKLD